MVTSVWLSITSDTAGMEPVPSTTRTFPASASPPFPLIVSDLISDLDTENFMPPQTFSKETEPDSIFPTAGNTSPEKLSSTPVCTAGMTVVTELPSQEFSVE